MKRAAIIFSLWLISLIFVTIWTYENPENIEYLKNYFKKNEEIKAQKIDPNEEKIIANSFLIKLSKIVSLSEKTAFIFYPDKEEQFDPKKLVVYSQNGFVMENLKSTKINLPNEFTLQRNGGLKTVIHTKDSIFGFISAKKNNCYYAAIVDLANGNEVFKSKCLLDIPKNIDFNGLGSTNIHFNKKIYLAVGTPEKHASKNSLLAQDPSSIFGKILEIEIKNTQNDLIEPTVFTSGHRVPQGLAKLNGNLFNVEHGPKGGDEINKLKKGNNYGWPIVSYGTNYLKDSGGDGKSYKINHSANKFEEPLFAFVPSIGISSLNNCPKVLIDYYKTPCLLALSLRGNNLRTGKSLIIFLLNNEMKKINSIEKIYLGNLKLRHFVTNKRNELYEDKKGNIYISADKKGIYRINFSNFR